MRLVDASLSRSCVEDVEQRIVQFAIAPSDRLIPQGDLFVHVAVVVGASGYNYLIDHKGAIYEGRAARVYGSGEAISNEDSKGWGVVGAHAKGNNAGSCGICMIGNFDTGSPTDAAVASLVRLLTYKASRYRIDATSSDEYIDLYRNHLVYPNIAGHRQVGSTVCPGRRLYGLLPTIRNEVARRPGHWDAVTVDVPGVVRWEIGKLRSGGLAKV